MASINISEADFAVVAHAAMAAKERGDMESALTLDKIARKINASLTNLACARNRRLTGKSMTWEEAPSTLI